jgi:hypothetical protein
MNQGPPQTHTDSLPLPCEVLCVASDLPQCSLNSLKDFFDLASRTRKKAFAVAVKCVSGTHFRVLGRLDRLHLRLNVTWIR